MGPAVVMAIAIPLVFLYLARWLDLYASGSFKIVLVCLGWGVVAFYCALQVNTFLLQFVGFGLLVALVAPIVEEILKSAALFYLVRLSDFTYFVDGAIYGFASGSAFAVLEGILYMSRAGEGEGLIVVLVRAFSTSLMHASATALVGVSLGRLRFGRGLGRLASVPLVARDLGARVGRVRGRSCCRPADVRTRLAAAAGRAALRPGEAQAGRGVPTLAGTAWAQT